MVDYLLSRYTDPLEGLLQLGEASVDELARGLQCSRLEAMAEKRLAWVAALPYLHQRLPLQVDVTAKRVVHLSIGDGAGGDGAGGDGAGDDGMAGDAESEEYQWLDGDADADV